MALEPVSQELRPGSSGALKGRCHDLTTVLTTGLHVTRRLRQETQNASGPRCEAHGNQTSRTQLRVLTAGRRRTSSSEATVTLISTLVEGALTDKVGQGKQKRLKTYALLSNPTACSYVPAFLYTRGSHHVLYDWGALQQTRTLPWISPFGL